MNEELLKSRIAILEMELKTLKAQLQNAKTGKIVSLPSKFRLIIEKVCEAWSISETELLSKSRTEPLARSRAMIAGLAQELLPEVSLVAQGRILGRDHSTIIHARQAHRDRVFCSEIYRTSFEKFKKTLEPVLIGK